MSAIFGPAGNAESFPYKSSVDAPRWLAELGLDCYEYQCGKGVNVREETARNIGAAAVAAVLNGFADRDADITVRLRGGDLTVRWAEDTVYMTGAAALAFTGEAEL